MPKALLISSIECSLISDTIIWDIIVKIDHFAILCMIGLCVETKKNASSEKKITIKRTRMYFTLNTA